jgi:hypothetical protein
VRTRERLLAAIFALLTAYVGTLGQAVAGRREFGGIMSKPWRMVTLHIGAWITLALLWWGDGAAGSHGDGRVRFGNLTVLDWTCLAIVAGCVQTMVCGMKRTFSSLAKKIVNANITVCRPVP